jgi:hypothetical protein
MGDAGAVGDMGNFLCLMLICFTFGIWGAIGCSARGNVKIIYIGKILALNICSGHFEIHRR